VAAYHVLDKSVRSSIESREVSKPCFSPVLASRWECEVKAFVIQDGPELEDR